MGFDNVKKTWSFQRAWTLGFKFWQIRNRESFTGSLNSSNKSYFQLSHFFSCGGNWSKIGICTYNVLSIVPGLQKIFQHNTAMDKSLVFFESTLYIRQKAFFTSFSLTIIPLSPQALFWILQPLSVLWSVRILHGRPILIHLPPFQYPLDIFWSTQMKFLGEKISYLSKLKAATKSSHNFH